MNKDLVQPHYPQPKRNIKLMTEGEFEAYARKLAYWHMVRYANECGADGIEVDATRLAEYAVDCMHEDDGLSQEVYDWLSDDIHWIWDLGLHVEELYNSSSFIGEIA